MTDNINLNSVNDLILSIENIEFDINKNNTDLDMIDKEENIGDLNNINLEENSEIIENNSESNSSIDFDISSLIKNMNNLDISLRF